MPDPIALLKQYIDEGKSLAEAKQLVHDQLPLEERAAAEELWAQFDEDYTVALRSEMWQQPDGSFRWELRHPASGLKTRGRAATVEEGYARMDEVARQWFGEPEKSDLLLTPHFDNDTGPADN